MNPHSSDTTHPLISVDRGSHQSAFNAHPSEAFTRLVSALNDERKSSKTQDFGVTKLEPLGFSRGLVTNRRVLMAVLVPNNQYVKQAICSGVKAPGHPITKVIIARELRISPELREKSGTN